MTPSQSNNVKWVGLFTLLILAMLALMWFDNNYLTHRMTQICENMSMTYFYQDTGSFYCLATNGTITTREIRYR